MVKTWHDVARDWFPAHLWGTSHLDPALHQYCDSDAEIRFAQLWVGLYPDLDLWAQYPLTTRSRWDFAHVEARVGIDIQGAVWAKGGHSTGKGIKGDMAKQRRAAKLGWVYVAIASDDVEDGDRLAEIAEVIGGRLSQNVTTSKTKVK